MTTLPRAATSPELAKLRADNQSTRLYLTVHAPATVYTARLSAVPSSTDKVASITYSSGSGTLADVLQDQTLLVGSAAGISDYGIARIRKGGTTTAGTFYIGETSEINWVSNAYLTVLDEFTLWPRHIAIASDGTTPLMDYDVAYTDQNTTEGAIPTPIMGPPAVLWLRGASVTYSPDASSSWVKDGTISTYAWACATADSITDDDTATPTFVFDAAGTHRVSLTVTGDNAVTFTGYRYVFVVTESSGVTTQFTLDSCAGDVQSGGWSYAVTLYDEATQALIRDRALCILHAVDYYGNTLGSVGYFAGNENIVALGWIAGESITRATEDRWSTVSFDVQGPQYWLGQMTAFPSGVKDVSDATTPNKWTKFRGLTLNKALYHFMRWRCTATRCMDVYPNSDTRRHKRLESPGGENIWSQLVEICQRSMLVNPLCDRYGRIFFELDHQLVSDRSGMPTVQALTTADWQGEIRMERRIADEVSLIDMSGIAWSGTAATSFFSLAPGHVFNHYGAVEVVDRLMLTDQASTNTLCGLYSAWKNNEYPTIDISLASDHRLFDITPYQRFTLAQAAADTPRGLVEALTIIPRSITYQFNNGVMLTDATFEAEVTADIAVTGDTPVDPPDPPISPVDPPAEPPAIDPILPTDAMGLWFATADAIYYSYDFSFGAVSQPTYTAVAALPTGTSAITRMCSTLDGATIYIIATVSSVRGLWKCANPKAATPTWTKVVAVGDAYIGGTVESFWSLLSLVPHGKTVTYLLANNDFTAAYHTEYNGTSTISTLIPASKADSYAAVTYRAYSTKGVVGGDYLRDLSYSNIGPYLSNDGRSSAPWVNMIGGNYYGVNYGPDDLVTRLRNINGDDNLIEGTGDTFGLLRELYPRGAWYGTEIDFVDNTGDLWTSSDGVTFTKKTTTPWALGVVEPARTTGGGPLVWLRKSVTDSNELIRVSNDGGVTWVAMTGNFWSIASGDQVFLNLCVVYA